MVGDFCQRLEETKALCGPCARLWTFVVRRALQFVAASCYTQSLGLSDVNNSSEILHGIGGFFNWLQHLSLDSSQMKIKSLLSFALSCSRNLSSLNFAFKLYAPNSLLNLLSNKHLFPNFNGKTSLLRQQPPAVTRALIEGRPCVCFVDAQWTAIAGEQALVIQAEFAGVEIVT